AQVTAARRHPAAGTGHGHVRRLQPRVADAAVQDVLDGGTVVTGIEPQPGHAGGEPVQVGVEPVEPALPDVHHVVGAVRPGHAQVEHGDPGVLDRTVPAIDPGRAGRPRRAVPG